MVNLHDTGTANTEATDPNKIYICKNCKVPLANEDDIVSRNFRGTQGKAILFFEVSNNVQTREEPRERLMTTGLHTIQDMECRGCHEELGWKYIKTPNSTQEYKRDKVILEANLLTKARSERL